MEPNERSIGRFKAMKELIDNASELPTECQDWLLTIAKGMAFTKSCLTKQIDGEPERPKTA